MPERSTRERYERAAEQIRSVISGLDDGIAVMASATAVLREAIPQASWIGFYRVVEAELLRIGPYQGPIGCVEIPFSQGVCGAAARTGKTQLVDDVHAFEGHIACDPSARSEIVVPIMDRSGHLVAVLDVDSHRPAAFDATDRDELEAIAGILGENL